MELDTINEWLILGANIVINDSSSALFRPIKTNFKFKYCQTEHSASSCFEKHEAKTSNKAFQMKECANADSQSSLL